MWALLLGALAESMPRAKQYNLPPTVLWFSFLRSGGTVSVTKEAIFIDEKASWALEGVSLWEILLAALFV